jgi:hypothetical protein
MPAFVRRRRSTLLQNTVHSEAPLSGVANLFDASIVFAVGVMIAAIQAFSLMQLLDPNSQFTITKRNNQTDDTEIIEKNQREIKVKKMSPDKKIGPSTRLGVAYQLPDGSVIYVPEEKLLEEKP